jgi:LacI family transcriptional regulator
MALRSGPGPRRIVLEDIARRAGVSRSSASRALADDPRISEPTRALVKRIARDLGYVPNAAARSLRVRRTRLFCLVLPDLSDPVHGQVASGFEQESSACGYRVIILAGLNDLVTERRALSVAIEHMADGVAMVSSMMAPGEAWSRVGTERLVVVQPDHRSMAAVDGPAPGVIRTDDAPGIRAAVEHLVTNGYRRIAFVESGDRASNTVRRTAARDALRALTGRSLKRFPAPDDAWRTPDELVRRIADDLPEALVCYDDKLALALMDGLRSLGIRVPDDVGIVGFDGIPFAATSNPRLTTVATPAPDLGRRAASALVDAVEAGRPLPSALLPVELMVRESTRAVRRDPVGGGARG